MLGLIITMIVLGSVFSFLTIFFMPKVLKKEPYQRVKYSREKMKFLAEKLLNSICVKIETIYEDENAIKNMDKNKPIVFVSNHSSNFDIPVLITALPIDIGFVAKKEMEKWPFYGKWMKQTGCVFLDRENPREGIRAIKKAIEIVKNGHPIVIFPQGTRKQGFGEAEFKKGSFKLATDASGYVVPITVQGSDKVQAPAEAKVHMNKKVKVNIGKPIKIWELNEEEVKELHKVVENNIREKYKQLA